MALTYLISLLLLVICVARVSSPAPVVAGALRDFDISVLKVLGNSRDSLSFARYAQSYGKSYETADETKLRFSIFSENLKRIRERNQKGLSHTLAVNKFADWTWEEFQEHRLGAAQSCSATTKGNHKLTSEVLPESKDWRKSGIVSAIKNQGACGSCWSFSATGALEAAYAQAFGKNISLSEQQLVDCAGAFNNSGCGGGLPSQAFEYIRYNGGPETDESYPYTAKMANAVSLLKMLLSKLLTLSILPWMLRMS